MFGFAITVRMEPQRAGAMIGVMVHGEAEIAALGAVDLAGKRIANGDCRSGAFGTADIENAGKLGEIVSHFGLLKERSPARRPGF
jgi:hypothetical protein